MNREDIEKAAGEYSGSILGFRDNVNVMGKHKAFVDGAEWRINSVWHDPSERPTPNTLCIAQTSTDAFDTFYDSAYGAISSKGRTLKRWTYAKDILPTKE